MRKTHLHYPLAMKNYAELRVPDPIVPRILIVVTLPDALDYWLMQTEDEMVSRHCAYWISLRGHADTVNLTSVTVRLPRAQIFTPGTLVGMMRQVNDGEAI
jgi:hypothetical protein